MLVWCDLETSGLDPATCVILEVGLVVTDDNLQILGEQAWVIHRSADERAAAHPRVQQMHDANNLWAQTVLSQLTTADVELQAISFLIQHNVSLGQIPLAGNTIGFDRSFLAEWMPDLLAYFHYRSIDVSTLTELARLWYPALYEGRPGRNDNKAHRVLDDLHNSIEQLSYYRAAIMKSPVSSFGP